MIISWKGREEKGTYMYPWFAKALSAGQGDRLSVGPAGMNGCDLACCSNALALALVLVLVEANIFCNVCMYVYAVFGCVGTGGFQYRVRSWVGGEYSPFYTSVIPRARFEFIPTAFSVRTCRFFLSFF